MFALLICLSMLLMLAFSEEGVKKKVELKDIPKEVMDIAKEKIKGFEGKDATIKEEKDGNKYEIKGAANGKNIEAVVKLDKSGKVTKVESEIVIDIKDVPKDVLAAAKEKVKGFEVKEAEVKEEINGKDGKLFALKGKVGSKVIAIDINVDSSGKVTKVEDDTKKEGDGDGD